MTCAEETDPDRVAKYRRVLPHLLLDRTSYVRGAVISVQVDPPIADRCDVTLRLVHSSGRTYGQQDRTLDPETHEFVLRKALNLPDGVYELIITPPLSQFYGAVPVERRLPLVIEVDEALKGLAAARSAAVASLAGGLGFASALARFVLGQGSLPVPETAADALLARLADPTFPLPNSLPEESALVVAVLTELVRPGPTAASDLLSERLSGIGRRGFGPAGVTPPDIVALATLGRYGGNATSTELAVMLLDKLAFGAALGPDSVATGAPLEEKQMLSVLQGHFFADARDKLAQATPEMHPSILALILARYEPPKVIACIAAAMSARPFSGTVSQRNHPHDIQSPFGSMSDGDAMLLIRHGNVGLQLDFTAPPKETIRRD